MQKNALRDKVNATKGDGGNNRGSNASVIPSYDHKHVLLAEGLPGRYL